jgi:hypothetical protein
MAEPFFLLARSIILVLPHHGCGTILGLHAKKKSDRKGLEVLWRLSNLPLQELENKSEKDQDLEIEGYDSSLSDSTNPYGRDLLESFEVDFLDAATKDGIQPDTFLSSDSGHFLYFQAGSVYYRLWPVPPEICSSWLCWFFRSASSSHQIVFYILNTSERICGYVFAHDSLQVLPGVEFEFLLLSSAFHQHNSWYMDGAHLPPLG